MADEDESIHDQVDQLADRIDRQRLLYKNMAGQNELIDEQVAQLADRIGCQLLSYTNVDATPTRHRPQRYLFPVGAYAIGLWQPGDDIHLVCLTDNGNNTFWDYIAESLNRDDLPRSDCIVSEPDSHNHIWLHYCSLPARFDLITLQAYGFPNYAAPGFVPQMSRNNLLSLEDTWHLINRLGNNIDTFREDYQTLRSWAEAAGIFSPSFSMLDAESLLWMVFWVRNTPDKRKSVVQSFMERYNDPASVQNVLTPKGLAAYNPPLHETAEDAAIIAYEINKLKQQPALLELPTEQYYQMFCESYTTLIIVQAECWLDKHIERFQSLLIAELSHLREQSFHEKIKFHSMRIWPHAFKPSEAEWVYVIGVDFAQPLDAFHEAIYNYQLNPDDTAGTVQLRACSAKEAQSLPQMYATATSSPPPNLNDEAVPSPSPSTQSAGQKLPPASQVLSRLRWDPAHASHSYEVGYLDRFEGLMWLPLEQWGKETEDEDFIPEHRIRIFRRVEKKGAHVVVWDREKRICILG